MGKLRVGCILDDPAQSAIVCDLIARSRRASSYAIELLVPHNTRPAGKRPFQRALLSLVERAERLLCEKLGYSHVLKARAPGCANIDQVRLNALASQNGASYSYSQDQLA